MSSHPRISRQHHRARPAEDTFTWHQSNGRINFGKLRAMVLQAEQDGVPDDADVQVSGVDVYLNWRREA